MACPIWIIRAFYVLRGVRVYVCICLDGKNTGEDWPSALLVVVRVNGLISVKYYVGKTIVTANLYHWVKEIRGKCSWSNRRQFTYNPENSIIWQPIWPESYYVSTAATVLLHDF